MAYVLYYNPDSANIVVRIALEHLGVAYRDQLVGRRVAQRDETFHRLNPRGLLPVLIDEENEAVVFETGAALLYLADRHGGLAPSPFRAAARADCLKWLFMLSNTLHADLRLRFYSDRYVSDESEIKSLRTTAAARVLDHLTVIDGAIAEHGGPWLLRTGFSVCDIYLGCCVRWAQSYPAEDPVATAPIESLTSLGLLLRQLQDLPAVRQAFAREGLGTPAFIAPPAFSPPEVIPPEVARDLPDRPAAQG